MNSVTSLDAAQAVTANKTAGAAKASAKSRPDEDMAMIRAAADLTRDLVAANPRIYWADFLASSVIGYAALALAIFTASTAVMVAAIIVSILALYRAGSFIHEITHIKRSAVPGFWLGWNVIAGIPLMIPSFMYEGVHNLHHARTRYGTDEDPEYLPLALMKPWTVPVFVLISAFAPIALLFRYGVLSPLSVIIPPLRTMVVERYSSLAINPNFRRRSPEGEARRNWYLLEAAVSIWAIALIALVATGIIPMRAFLIFLAVASGSIVLNQVRTLVAHLWENEGEVMSVTAQFLDSVNVPPPAMLPALWAPVGLRYHAIHHLLPGVPYHNLGEAHRRLSTALDGQSSYHKANYGGLPGLVVQLIKSTIHGPRAKA